MGLASVSSRIRYYVRLVIYISGLGSVAFAGIFSSIYMALIGKRYNAPWVVARTFYGLVGRSLGITMRVEGKEYLDIAERQPCVIVGNHQTMFDILYLGAIFPKRTSIMSKKELKYTPFLGQFMMLSNAIFINRSNRKSAIDTFSKVADDMKRKQTSLFIFAEGTRHATNQPGLLPLKKGAFHLAVQGQMPIIPVVCENYWNVYSSKAKRFTSGEIGIKALPPIKTEGFTSSSEDIAQLAEKTRNAMLDALQDLASRPGSCSGAKEVQREPIERTKKNRESQPLLSK